MKDANTAGCEDADLSGAAELWDAFVESCEDDDGVVAEHLAAGRPVYFREQDTPPGHVAKLYPNGRLEWVIPSLSNNKTDRVMRVLVEGS